MTINESDSSQEVLGRKEPIRLASCTPMLYEDKELLRALFEIKKACAEANCTTGLLSREKAEVIRLACERLIAGKATRKANVEKNAPFNVIASTIDEMIIEFSEGVSREELDYSQSSNDVLLSAQSIALYRHVLFMLASVRELEEALEENAVRFSACVRCGRIGQRDSVPMTFGQVIAGWKASLMRARKHVEMLLPEQLELVLGGTVLGTGLGASPSYRRAVYEALRVITNLPVYAAQSPSAVSDSAFFGIYQGHGRMLALMGAVKEIGYAVGKVANDLYVFSSGPRTGYREFVLPTVAPGSSIMPGKLNPLMPELVLQVMQQVFANDTMLSLTCNDLSLDVDTFASDAYAAVSESLSLLKGALHQLTELCIRGLEINAEFCANRVTDSLALSHVVGILFGSETEKRIRTQAVRTAKSVATVCMEEKLLTEQEVDVLFSPVALANAESSAQLFATFRTKHPRN